MFRFFLMSCVFGISLSALAEEKIYVCGQDVVCEGLSEDDDRETKVYDAKTGELISGIVRQYYENGHLKREGNIKDSRNDGLWKLYYENGNLQEEAEWKDGNRNGMTRVYDENGVLIKETHYAIEGEDIFCGGLMVVSTFDIPEDGYFCIDTKNHKAYTGIVHKYASGALLSETEVKDGKREGKEKTYFGSGQLSGEWEYHDGNLEGPYKQYYDNGQLKEEGDYHNNKVNGKRNVYYKNGQLWMEGSMKDGKIDGELLTYYENGWLKAEDTFLDEKVQGVVKSYYDNGQLKKEEIYEHNMATGEHKTIEVVLYNQKGERIENNLKEEDQMDADIVRMHHFDYYAQLLEEYKEKTGKYPFQYDHPEGIPLYVFIMTDEQEIGFDTQGELNTPDTDFFKELEKGLGRDIDEKYDPKRVSIGCPAVYLYMVYKDKMYFAVHLHHPNSFTKINGPNCHKIELANFDMEERKFYTYNTFKNNTEYQKMIKAHPTRNDYFLQLDKENRKNSLKDVVETGIPDEFYSAIQDGNVEFVKESLQKNQYNLNPPYIKAKKNQFYKPLKPLYWAARAGQIEIAKILLEAGADINGLDGFHDTALITALENKKTDMVKFLVEQGANVNIPTSWGVTPFMGVCASGTPEMVELMIRHGADVNKAFKCTVDDCIGQYNNTPLEFAKQNRKYSKEITDLLIKAGAPK